MFGMFIDILVWAVFTALCLFYLRCMSRLVVHLLEDFYISDTGIKIVICLLAVMSFVPILNTIMGMFGTVAFLIFLVFRSGIIERVFTYFTGIEEDKKDGKIK